MNLLSETIEILTNYNKNPRLVHWVGSRDGSYAIQWKDFEALARDVEYNEIHGGQEIASDLVVVGGSWWLERRVNEHDGSEWWEFKTLPTFNGIPKAFTKVDHGSWDTLHELQQKEGTT